MLRHLRFENIHTDIFTPRAYQVALLHKALQRNTIVCLGSATGKTFISVLLIKELGCQLRKPLQNGGKRTIYLVEKASSAEYRSKALALHTDLTVATYVCQSTENEEWDQLRWEQELQWNQVLLLSPGRFQRALDAGYVCLDQINMLVLDSCQHVLENEHPYLRIMQYYFDLPLGRQPRILGLTASLLNNQCKSPKELQDKLQALQKSLASKAETASDMMLAAMFGTKPTESILECEPYEDETGLVEQFENIIGSALYFLEYCNFGVKKSEASSADSAYQDADSPDGETTSPSESNNIRPQSCQTNGQSKATCAISKPCDQSVQSSQIQRLVENGVNHSSEQSETSDLTISTETCKLNADDTSCSYEQDTGFLKNHHEDTIAKGEIHAKSESENSSLDSPTCIDRGEDTNPKGKTQSKSEHKNSSVEPSGYITLQEETHAKSETENSSMDSTERKESGKDINSEEEAHAKSETEHSSVDSTSCKPDADDIHIDSDGEWKMRSLKDDEEVIKVPRIALLECYNILHLLGPWCAGRVAETLAKQVEKLLDVEREEWTRRFLHFTHTQLSMVAHVMNQVFDYEVMYLDDFLRYVSPKVKRLLETLYDYKPSDDFTIMAGDEFLDGASDGGDTMSDEEGSVMDSGTSDMSECSNHASQQQSNKMAVDSCGGGLYVAKKVNDGQETKDENLFGIVFVERRHTAFILNKLLEEMCNWDEKLFFLKSHHFTGQGYSKGVRQPTDPTVYKKQEDILRKFRRREFNLLVSTGVLEDGLDVPRCNFVMRFDPPYNYRSYIQSKGRARAINAKFLMLVDSDERDKFNEDLETFRGFEKLMCQALQEIDEEREEPLPDDGDSLLPPYTAPSPSSHPPADTDADTQSSVENNSAGTATGATVTMSSAIALVNRYCAKLPSDAFTHLVPDCTTEELPQADGSVKYRCTLQLPINSPIKKPIVGHVMDSKKLAKMAVALKTCEVLHREGEIDDQFLPIGKEMIRYEDEDNEWEETEGQARPGTTKRKQYYLKKIAGALLGRPQPDKPCFMYALNMTLTCPITEEQNTRGRQIYAPESSPRGFGFLSESKIPLVPHFPVFTRSGEVTVSIDLVWDGVTFTREQLHRFENFHKFLFSRVLRLDKDPMKYIPTEAAYSSIIVPIQTGGDNGGDVRIDWEFLERIEKCPMKVCGRKYVFPKQPNDEDGKFIYRQGDFEDAVVMPSYRNIDQPQYFYVAETRHDINPMSPFPSPELYDTFFHYYSNKYGLVITNKEQPLLDVDHTSARLNLLTPRYMNQKGVALPTSSAETRKQKRENLQQKQILVPELCNIHPFPASLWRKAVCIPAIFYRLNYLLIADEIRIMIASQAKIGVFRLPYDHRFPKLELVFPERSKSEADKGDDTAASNQGNGVSGESIPDENVEVKEASSNNSNAEASAQSNAQASDETVKVTECVQNKASCDKRDVGHTCSADSITIGDQPTVAIASDSSQADLNGKTTECLPDSESVSNKLSTLSISQNKEELTQSSEVTEIDNGTNQSIKQENVRKEAESNAGNESDKTRNLESDTEDFISFDDEDIDLKSFIGPSPCLILQTLTMSNANDFFNLERLETIGDSFLKFAITVYLYCTYPGIHEGKLSYLRSKQVSNYNLYRLGKKTGLPECMVACKFEPSENWLPPGFVIKQSSVLQGLEVFVTSSADLNVKKDESQCYYIDNAGRVSNVDGHLVRWVDMTFDDVDKEQPLDSNDAAATSGLNSAILTEVTDEEASMFMEEPQENSTTIEQISDHVTFTTESKTRIANKNGVVKPTGDDNESCAASVMGKASEKNSVTVERNMASKQNADTAKGSKEANMVSEENADTTEAHKEINMTPADKATDDEASDVTAETSSWEKASAKFQKELEQYCEDDTERTGVTGDRSLTPYNLQTQHSLPDKSIADCVEALIGCYLVTCGQRAALQFMAWLGLKVLPDFENQRPEVNKRKSPFCGFQRPPSPLLLHVPQASERLEAFLDGYEAFDATIQYRFKDRSYLLQAFTHASYHYNTITDCYQRLEFLGDAILDYVITRHLFEDSKKHSPGILTDLRSALVNNNIFAALAVKWDFHKYFKAVSPHLFSVINKFVQWQKERGDVISVDEEFGDFMSDDDTQPQSGGAGKEEGEDIEIPKALGDIFESVAGAVYLDSGMSLDVVWRVYYRMMKPYIDAFSERIPKSPVRELLEMEPETAKFERPERTMDGKIRVTVTVVGKGSFSGVGRNYRIAKSAAAKRALKQIRLMQLELERQAAKGAYMAGLMFMPQTQ